MFIRKYLFSWRHLEINSVLLLRLLALSAFILFIRVRSQFNSKGKLNSVAWGEGVTRTTHPSLQKLLISMISSLKNFYTSFYILASLTDKYTFRNVNVWRIYPKVSRNEHPSSRNRIIRNWRLYCITYLYAYEVNSTQKRRFSRKRP